MKRLAIIDNIPVKLIVQFYSRTNMPMIVAYRQNTKEIYTYLTSDSPHFEDQSIALKPNDKSFLDLLIKNEFINDILINTEPIGKQTIEYYQLTDKAYEQIQQIAQDENIQYPPPPKQSTNKKE